MSYKLRLAAWTGCSPIPDEGDMEECRKMAADAIRRHRNVHGWPVSIQKRGWEWELESDPDGEHMIGDGEGVLYIEQVCDECKRKLAEDDYGDLCEKCQDAADECVEDADDDDDPVCWSCLDVFPAEDDDGSGLCVDCIDDDDDITEEDDDE